MKIGQNLKLGPDSASDGSQISEFVNLGALLLVVLGGNN